MIFFFWGGGGSILRNIKGRAMRAWTMYTARMKSKRRGEWWTVNGHLKYSKRFQNGFVSLAFFSTAERQLHFSIFVFDSLPALCDPRNPLSSLIRIKKVLACLLFFQLLLSVRSFVFCFVFLFYSSGFIFHEPKKLPVILTFSLGPPKPPRL